jgi:hypothetical protein
MARYSKPSSDDFGGGLICASMMLAHDVCAHM